jgi:hypothetical protein
MMRVKVFPRSLLHPSSVCWIIATNNGGKAIGEEDFMSSRSAIRLSSGRPVALVGWWIGSVKIAEEPPDPTLAFQVLATASPFT